MRIEYELYEIDDLEKQISENLLFYHGRVFKSDDLKLIIDETVRYLDEINALELDYEDAEED